MVIEDAVKLFSFLPLSMREARNVALACVLEPLSDKVGCVTRYVDTRNTLEMFLTAGVNIFPAYFSLAEHLQKKGAQGMYTFFHNAVLLSKMHRAGGQINLGILEFSFPICAAHILLDPESKRDAHYLLDHAGDILRDTTEEDVKEFMAGKEAARELSYLFRGKTYPLYSHNVLNVYDHYVKEYEREIKEGGHPTGVTHNKQFSHRFSEIRTAYEVFQKASSEKFSDRLVDAYEAVMLQDIGIGPGLAADFIAVVIYLALTYANGDEIVVA